MSGPPVYSFMKKVNWTPLSLGSKLLNWWDGTIVDEDPATEVNSWEDQKGSFDWQNAGAGKKAEYDSDENLIIFLPANQEFLENDANAAGFQRSTGEYWIVLDLITGIAGQNQIFSTSTFGTNNKYFLILSSNDIIRIVVNETFSIITEGTTEMISGKNILRVSSIGASYVVNLNGVDITSEYSSGDGFWEDFLSTPTNLISLAALRRPSPVYSPLRIHALLRTEILTTAEVTELYNYLNAKY